MRALILIIAIVVLMALIGWVTFGVGPNRSSINLETEEIRQDTREALASGAEALDKAGDSIRSENSAGEGSAEARPNPARQK
jgi:hypothetical protein